MPLRPYRSHNIANHYESDSILSQAITARFRNLPSLPLPDETMETANDEQDDYVYITLDEEVVSSAQDELLPAAVIVDSGRRLTAGMRGAFRTLVDDVNTDLIDADGSFHFGGIEFGRAPSRLTFREMMASPELYSLPPRPRRRIFRDYTHPLSRLNTPPPRSLPSSSSSPPRRRKISYDSDLDLECLQPPTSSSGSLEGSIPQRARSCSFLQAGRVFLGAQSLLGSLADHQRSRTTERDRGRPTPVSSSLLDRNRLRTSEQEVKGDDRWEVKVMMDTVDLQEGTLTGLMEALNVPATGATTVVTAWEGEIVDGYTHSLWTGKWNAERETDLIHWRRMLEEIEGIPTGSEGERTEHGRVLARELKLGRIPQYVCERYVLMRWKERSFVNITPQESGLTIAGFYYVLLRRSDGAVRGFYHDPQSAPFQRLELNVVPEGRGFGFGQFEFA